MDLLKPRFLSKLEELMSKHKSLCLVLLLLTIAFHVGSFVCLKISTMAPWASLFGLVNLFIIFSFGFLVLKAVSWQFVLKGLDLSFACAFMAILPVILLTVSVLIFRESVTIGNMVGALMISAGIMLLSYSKLQKNEVESVE